MGPAPREYAEGVIIPGSIYRVVRCIGRGGMGTVYDVEDTTIGKLYVLKTLHPQLGAREDLARRMQKESRTLARLQHPNIVEVITAGVTDDDMRLPFYVMERLSGQSLRVVLDKKGQVDLPHAIHIAIDLLDALDHAHDAGVIHRDVKPDNIFLHRTTAGMTVTKLLDFGIVSLLDAANRETAGKFLGTLQYAAPEQLRGEAPTPRMDIYCAGLVLYEMVAGRGPFYDEGDAMKIGFAHMNKTAPRVSEFVIVPKELERLLAAALEKDPDRRPRDAYSFAASLRNFKRTLAPAPHEIAHPNTGNRATTPSVLDPEQAPAALVEVQRPGPDGRYVVSPAAPVEVPAPPSPPTPPGPLPKTTMRGMVPPTVGGPIEVATSVPRTTPDVDRQAETHSMVAQALPAPAAHTVPLAQPVAAEAIAPLRWPPEQPPARSEEPQVRSLPASGEPAQSSRAAVVLALASIGGLALVAGGLLVLRHQAALHATAAAAPPALVTSATPPPPLPEPVVTMPAPTVAVPALDDSPPPPVPSVSASASTTPAKPRTAKPAFAPTPTPTPTPTPAPAPAPAPTLPDRPGPGF